MVSLFLGRAGLMAILYTMAWMLLCNGNPIGKRSVSEHQEMHDRSRFLQDLKRRQWLENMMKDLHTAVEVLPRDEATSDLPRWRESSTFPQNPGSQEEISRNRRDIIARGGLADGLEKGWEMVRFHPSGFSELTSPEVQSIRKRLTSLEDLQ